MVVSAINQVCPIEAGQKSITIKGKNVTTIKSSPRTYTCDVAVHSDVVQVVFLRFNFPWIFLGFVFAGKQFALSKLGVVVKIYFRIETHDYKRAHRIQ